MNKMRILGVVLLAILLISTFVFTYLYRSSMSSIDMECDFEKTLSIDVYELKRYTCSAMGGSPFKKYELYQQDSILSPFGFVRDSCLVIFASEADSIFTFNVCKQKLIKIDKDEKK